MRSEIRNIRRVAKFGVYGRSDTIGYWAYGRRPDGRTVACRTEVLASGTVIISSNWRSPNCKEGETNTCVTKFTKQEWSRVESLGASECNRILDSR